MAGPKRNPFAVLDEPDPWPEDEVTEVPAPQAIEAAKEVAATLAPEKTARQGLLDEIRGIEDQLLIDASEVVSASVNFAVITEGQEGYPVEWETEKGWSQEKCWRIFRIMKASWKSAKEAPVGIAVAQRTHVGITKARAAEKAAPRALAMFFLPPQGAAPKELPEEVIDAVSE